LFTLTDNPLEISGRQQQGGIIDLFERRFSLDETVKRHKPAPEAYHSVTAALDLAPASMCLVASHVWDTIGALAAGCQAGLILRAGNARSRSARSPITSARTLTPSPTSSSNATQTERHTPCGR
jgi:2-haloacid dehalogenase